MDTSCSITEALSSISSKNSESNENSGREFREIKFYVNEELGEDFDERSFGSNFKSEYTVLVTFHSVVENFQTKIFWKTANQQKYYLLEIFDNKEGSATKICHNFIVEELKNKRTGKWKC